MAIQHSIRWPAHRWSAHRLSVQGRPATGGLRRLAERFGRRLSRALRRLQYGRMKSVLAQLPDDRLAQIGIRRDEIPAHARRLIYGADL